MVVVFDSASYQRRDRLEIAKVVFQEQSAPSTVRFDTTGGMSAVMEAWSFGGASMFRASMTGNHLLRSPRHVRDGPSGKIALAVQERGIGRFEQFGVQRLIRPGDLMVVDLDMPYEFGWAEIGSSRCVHVPFEKLGLSHTEFLDAAGRLHASPLYDTVRRHIVGLCIDRDGEIGGDSCEALGVSTLSLSRALLVSAYDPDADLHRDQDVSLPRIRAHIRERLADPRLTLESIARNYGFTAAELRQWTRERGLDLEQWILAERLHGVRDNLRRSPAPPDAELALRWGFVDLPELRAAFLDNYGIGIGQWWEIRHEP